MKNLSDGCNIVHRLVIHLFYYTNLLVTCELRPKNKISLMLLIYVLIKMLHKHIEKKVMYKYICSVKMFNKT